MNFSLINPRQLVQAIAKYQKEIYFLILGVYLVSTLSLAFDGGMTYDEEVDYIGLRDQLSFALKVLSGERPDFQQIHDNLEFYGIAGKLPGWILWFAHKQITGLGLGFNQALNSFHVNHLREDFFAFSRLSLIPMALLMSLFVRKSAAYLKISLPWLAAASCLLFPSLVGQSYFNVKDFPFALFYTAYTASLIFRLTGNLAKPQFLFLPSGYLISIFPAAALISTKAITVIPYMMTEFICFILIRSQHNRFPRGLRFELRCVLVGVLLTLLTAVLMHPAAWLEPFRYAQANIDAFSHNARSHCGLLLGSCIGPEHQEWNAASYIISWLLIKIPLFFLIGIVLFIAYLSFLPPANLCLWIPVILQATLIPALASIKNSSLYAQDRHLLFIYPALILVAFGGYNLLAQKITDYPRRLFAVISGLAVFLFGIFALDSLIMQPYQYLYISELTRPLVNSSNTITDYLGYGANESLKRAFRQGDLPRSNGIIRPVTQFPLNSLVEHHGLHQISSVKAPRLIYHSTVRETSSSFSPASAPDESCRVISQVRRSLVLSPKPIEIGALWSCEKSTLSND